jgi:sugar O-acyltransferase (sialic acid O-acetyltransferase NeuD family)
MVTYQEAGMRDLIILGTGVHALEMVEIVERVNRASPSWNLLGLITAEQIMVGQVLNGAPVLGMPDDLGKYPRADLVPSWADLKAMGDLPLERFVSLIDPSTFISRTAVIGRGCVFYPNCFVGLNAKVDDLVFVMTGSVINHDDVIGTWTAITTGVKLAGSVTVEPECYLGQGCNVRQLLTIGRHSIIGIGAVVVKNVEPNSVMAGIPARRIRTNLPES